MDRAVTYLLETDFFNMDAGKYPIDGENVFAMIKMPETKSQGQACWESHRKYVDIQYLLKGSEIIGFQNTGGLTERVPYNKENDIAFYHDNGKGFFPLLVPDSFVICFPWDAHMPLICAGHPQKIKKVVIKVLAEREGKTPNA